MDRTRARITGAAIELHGTVGPAATTISAVAERAGVTRATLYRHFATESELFGACSREWLAAHPRPNLGAWEAIGDPAQRLATALGEMYRYYRATEAMVGNLLRDLDALPPPIGATIARYPDQMADVLDRDWREASATRRAAILLAVSFETWRTLAHAGLDDDRAANLMWGLVVEAR